MKLKLKKDELHALILAIKECHEVQFNTKLEQRMCGATLKEFTVKLVKKAAEGNEKTSVGVDNTTLLALDFVLPQLIPENAYSLTVVREISSKINQACLNI